MAFSDFTWAQLRTDLGLEIHGSTPLFASITPVEPSEMLLEWMRRNYLIGSLSGGEKIRSEVLIAPMLLEARYRCDRKIALFSGAELNVDPARGLRGFCDFILCASDILMAITAPVLVVVEAKFENLSSATPQCIAAMVAAQKFNRDAGQPAEDTYGVISTGMQWGFLRLRENTVDVHQDYPLIDDAPKILGILLEMLKVPVTRADPSPRATNPTDHHPEPLHV